MRWDLNNTEGLGGKYPKFEKGKRYTLVIASAEDKFAKNEKATPYQHIKFETEALEPAHDKKLWNTEAAAWRAKEWVKAFGFKGEGDEDVPSENLKGIRFSAECDMVKGSDDKYYVEWINPLPIKIGEGGPARTESKPAAAAATKPAANTEEENEVPF